MPRQPKQKNASESRKLLAMRGVYADLCNGVTMSQIYYKLENDGYGIGYNYAHRSAIDICWRVKRTIEKDWEEEREDLKYKLFTVLSSILEDSKKSHDRSNAIKATEVIGKLGGCFEPQKIEAKIDSNIVIDFGIEAENESTEVNED